jgi:hypothetical protein
MDLEHVIFEEFRLGGGSGFVLAPPGFEDPRTLTSAEEDAHAEKHRRLQQKAEQRQKKCWLHNCNRPARTWVREVSFDFKGDRASPLKHAAVSSGDITGPVPGFCPIHLGTGPAQLAEAVYCDRPEIQAGVQPLRWFVAFTDDTVQGGDIREIRP